jgi:imidazole glycerol-phosphate synthase subunit HisF
MQFTRVIPVLLLKNNGLVKTVKFKNSKYIGDPINAMKIFNTKEVDELVILDIMATKNKREPDYKFIKEIVSEAFMPIGYGGGVSELEHIRKLFQLGVDKVIINSAAILEPDLIKKASEIYGNQSIIVSLDVKKDMWGQYKLYSYPNNKKIKLDLFQFIKKIESLGAGEIIVNSVDNDGVMNGYDTNLVESVAKSVKVPVIALGGAGSIKDLKSAVIHGASAVAAGSLFVYQGIHRGVLISYIKSELLMKEILKK